MTSDYPSRIVCLTDETTETLYALGEQWRIVGISAHSVRPPAARAEKPRVCSFTTADTDNIVALAPDLVLGFSDLQAEMTARLVKRGIEVHVFNHRSVAGILRMIRVLGGMIGCSREAEALADRLARGLEEIEDDARHLDTRPRIYFEEWDDPLISGIGWVSELIAIAGGEDCFANLARKPLAKDRVIADPIDVVRRQPDIIIGSWCGKKFQPDAVAARRRWTEIPAVQTGELHEVDSSLILQPGPAALTDGVRALHEIIRSRNARR